MRRHRDAFSDSPVYRNALDVGGEYAYRVRGEDHVWTATTVAALQHAVRGNSLDQYRAYAKVSNEQSERLLTIRGMFTLKTAEQDGRQPVPIEEVEPAKSIVRRFATGAMSYGSISREAHTTLAIAGTASAASRTPARAAKSRTDTSRCQRRFMRSRSNGRLRPSSSVTANISSIQGNDADQIAQGRSGKRPPGHKVDKTIAKVRHSAGVGLISPPHCGIYSSGSGAASSTSRTSIPPATCR